MKIYLASRYSRRLEMLGYAEALQDAGHTVTSRWVFGAHDLPLPDDVLVQKYPLVASLCAEEDIAGVQAAELLVLCTAEPSSTGGMWVELGLALAWNLRVWLVGPRANIFCALPRVRQFADVAAVIEALAVEATHGQI